MKPVYKIFVPFFVLALLSVGVVGAMFGRESANIGDVSSVMEIVGTVEVMMTYPMITAMMVFAAMRAGARGYLLKGASPDEMLCVIRAVAEGQALFGNVGAERLMNYFQELCRIPVAARDESPFPELTECELEVLRQIAQGLNNQEIAQKLVISPKTVHHHITSIFSKLQAANRAQLIALARQAGLEYVVFPIPCFQHLINNHIQRILFSQCTRRHDLFRE